MEKFYGWGAWLFGCLGVTLLIMAALATPDKAYADDGVDSCCRKACGCTDSMEGCQPCYDDCMAGKNNEGANCAAQFPPVPSVNCPLGLLIAPAGCDRGTCLLSPKAGLGVCDLAVGGVNTCISFTVQCPACNCAPTTILGAKWCGCY